MKLLEKIKNYFLNYTFLELIAVGESYSTNIKVVRNFDGSIWAGKISRPLPHTLENFRDTGKPYIRKVDFRDMDDRAALGFRLAKIAGLKSLKHKIVPLQRIDRFDNAMIGHEKMNDNIFLTEFKGQSLTTYLTSNSFLSFEASDIKNKDEVIRSFVFNLWIGNYDNKDKDYLVDENKNIISIDYHISGPGFIDDPKLAVGSWGEAFAMDSPPDTGWCIGDGKLLEYLKKHKNDEQAFEEMVRKINSIPESQIKSAMRGLQFYKQSTRENINDSYLAFLLERRPKLMEAIRAWVAADCPLVRLPKDNGIL